VDRRSDTVLEKSKTRQGVALVVVVVVVVVAMELQQAPD